MTSGELWFIPWRRWPAIGAVLLLLCTPGVTVSATGLAGLSLPAAISELQARGLRVIFSDALVTAEQVVDEEPSSTDLRLMLEEILKPHGLTAREGPGGQLVVVRLPASLAPTTGSIAGRIELDSERLRARNTTVRVVDTGLAAEVDESGRFAISGLAPGEYAVEASAPGLRAHRINGVVVAVGETATLVFHLLPDSVFLNEIVVTPSHFRILDREPEQRTFLDHESVAQMPHAADDLYRAVKRLPGAAGGDYSAKFSVRGGEQEELLVMLDGVELYEPFHLKDFQSMFSIIDTEATGGVDFLTGGFPVEYGDRMSGVMDISTVTPRGPRTTSLAASTINARVASEGTFNSGRGQWLVNARAWYPDRVADLALDVAKEIGTDYFDVFAKLQHDVGAHSQLSGNLLVAGDDLRFTEEDEESMETVTAVYGSHQLWLNLRTDWSDALFSQTVISSGRIRRERDGGSFDLEVGSFDVTDHRRVEFYGFRQDWSYQLNDSHYLKWGVESQREKAEYDYRSSQEILDPDDGETPPRKIDTAVAIAPAGTSYGAWVADRFRLAERWVAELGLRWDRQFYVGEHQISPRVNLLYELGERTTLRAAWGRFHQSQRLNELQVEDGEDQFYPAQLAQHTTLSMEHRFEGGIAMRVEAYRKDLERLRPRFENLFNPIEVFPESSPDRVRIAPDSGLSQGIELLLRDDSHEPLQWWLSYALARADDRIDGRLVPRAWDQRHALSFGLNLRLPRNWNLNLAGTAHSGWPTTPVFAEAVDNDEGEVEYELVLGARNSDRYSDFLRLDLRATRSFHTRFGDIQLMLEVLNLTDRENVCCSDDFEAVVGDDGALRVIAKESYWARFIPSLGVSWSF